MYDVENRSAILGNVAGFARLYRHVYGPVTNWRHRSMFIHWGNKLHVPPECCTSQNASSAEFLGAQIALRVLVYNWDL